MIICLTAVAGAVLLGVGVGIISGMSCPGKTDSVLMRIVDVQMGYPFIVLVIILISLFGQSIPSLALVLALSFWAPYARNIRGSVMIQKDADYIAAARLMGAGKGRIATKYIGREVIPGIIPVVPMDLSSAIIIESLLSYMGLGVQPPIISLGSVMGDGKNYISTNWWITAMPRISDRYYDNRADTDGRCAAQTVRSQAEELTEGGILWRNSIVPRKRKCFWR